MTAIRSKRRWRLDVDGFVATVTTIRLSAYDAQQYRMGMGDDDADMIGQMLGMARAWLIACDDVTIDGDPVVCDPGQLVEAMTPEALGRLCNGVIYGESVTGPTVPS